MAPVGCAPHPPPRAQTNAPHAAFLAPCPSSPNCVSSLATDAEHHVEPLRIVGDPTHAIDDLRRIIEGMPRARIVAANSTGLHAEFRSRIFRFIDDVDLQLDGHVVQIRSASRTGYSDFGVNRERVEAIRQAFARQPQGYPPASASQSNIRLRRFSRKLVISKRTPSGSSKNIA
jgi:uncharacterized protein (DUF1499 family)